METSRLRPNGAFVEHRITANGLELRCVERRSSSGQIPLLLMNGIGANLETFMPFVDELDPARPVVCFDAPGVGGSPRARRPYRFSTLSSALSEACTELGYGIVDVLGLSWGGALAQQFAWSAKGRTRRLVLVATGTGALMVPGDPRVLSKMITPKRYRDRQYVVNVAPELYGGSARSGDKRLGELLATIQRADQSSYAMQLLCGLGWTSLPYLPIMSVETLVLAGDDDPIVPSVNGRILHRLLRRSALEIYHGGHIELVANPRLLAPTIECFLDGGIASLATRYPSQTAS